jgi:hypothetical protein
MQQLKSLEDKMKYFARADSVGRINALSVMSRTHNAI